MKRTLKFIWSEIDLQIKHIRAIEVTLCYTNVPFV